MQITDGLDSEQRYYLQRSRAKRSDESDLEYANNSITLVVKTSSDLQVLSPDDVAFRLNTRNSAVSNQSMANDIHDEDFLSADMKEEVDIQSLYTSDISYMTDSNGKHSIRRDVWKDKSSYCRHKEL